MKHLLLSLSLLLALSGFGAVLSPEAALERAMNSADAPARVRGAKSASTPRLLHTQLAADLQPALYLFDTSDAFLLVSANDAAPALLGYGESGLPDADAIAPEFQWWMEEYGRQIDYMVAAGSGSAEASPASSLQESSGRERVNPAQRKSASMAPVAPMLTTLWGQDAPFNDLCPLSGSQRTVTGCVATALAQILNYHQWPPTGEGSHSYTTTSLGRTLSLNFANLTFEWDKMLDTYNGSESSASKQAVANLMYALGVASDMNYSLTGSGANSYQAAIGLANYMRYQDGIVVYSRNLFPVAQWDETVYNELTQYGPVYYAGQSQDGGHAFVADGYDGNGFFHINWGWNGLSNGYFRLSALDPSAQGTGGSSSGYNFDQEIMTRLKPEKPGDANQFVTPYMLCYGFGIDQSSATKGSTISVSGSFFNLTSSTFSCTLGLRAVSTTGAEYFMNGSDVSNLEPFQGFGGYYVAVGSNIPNGTYLLHPTVRGADGNYYDMGFPAGSKITMTVSGNRATFGNAQGTSISITNLAPASPLNIAGNYALSFNISNTGSADYVGSLFPVFLNSANNPVLAGADYPVYLASGESQAVNDYISPWYVYNGQSPAAGTYWLCLADADGYIVSDKVQVQVSLTTGGTSLSFTDFKVVGDADAVPKNNVHFQVTVKCVSGYMSYPVTAVIFPYTSGTVYAEAQINSETVFLQTGESKTVDIVGSFESGQVGKTYFANIYVANNNMNSDNLVFTLAEEYDPYFKFIDSEWSLIPGKGKLKDPWFSEVFEPEVQEYDVDIYRNIADPNRYAIFDPYGEESVYWDDNIYNFTNRTGYVVFNLLSKDFVAFEPYVYSGTFDIFDDRGAQDFYLYNVEGYYYYIGGYDTATISNHLKSTGMVSYYDSNEGKVYVYNGVFDMLPSSELGGAYSWTNSTNSGYIVFPQEFNPYDFTTQVMPVGLDSEDMEAEPEYYTLQGVRVSNPGPGIYIMRKGNVAKKVILR